MKFAAEFEHMKIVSRGALSLPEMLADKHPDVLGSPAREVFPEIWDKLDPLFEHVRSSGEATRVDQQRLDLFRQGGLEEAYFDYTLNPILDADGGVAGFQKHVVKPIGPARLRELVEDFTAPY